MKKFGIALLILGILATMYFGFLWYVAEQEYQHEARKFTGGRSKSSSTTVLNLKHKQTEENMIATFIGVGVGAVGFILMRKKKVGDK